MPMKTSLILAACLSLFSVTSWAFDAKGPVRETGFNMLGSRMNFSYWKDGCWDVEYRVPVARLAFSYHRESGIVETSSWGADGEWMKYALPSGWTVTFRGVLAEFDKEGREPVRFRLPAGNHVDKVVVDDVSGRAIIGTQTDNAAFLMQLLDLKTGKAVDVDLSPLENREDSDWPDSRPDEFTGHWIHQGGVWKTEDGKPGHAAGTPYMAGRVGDFFYTLYMTFSMDLRQAWPKEGGKAVLTVGKSCLEKEPYADFAGK